MTQVKICGITSWRDAKLAVDAGARILGFNFYRPSPRYIRPAAARRIIERLPRGVEAAGVFVNETPERIARIARATKLDWVQLHGDESPEAVAETSKLRPVVKAFCVRPGFRVATLSRYKKARAFLLDGYSKQARGGTGKRFDWRIARGARRYGRIFLAGGLTPENAADAVRFVRPYAIDVCSGVEMRPGKKDPARLRALMRNVRMKKK